MASHPPPGPYDDDEEDEYSGEEDEEDYSNSDISSDGDYDSERSLPPPEASEFMHFGSSLQVKGTYVRLILFEVVLILNVRRDPDRRRRSAEE
jgi:hypothetical protein